MSQPDTLYCQVRKETVAALPEELVRQRALKHMCEDRGFPQGLLSVETSLRQIPHLSLTNLSEIPDRRIDIIGFAKGIHPQFDLHPLIIVECKAVNLTSRTINQVAGYNHFVKASFIAIVNESKWQVGWFDHQIGSYSFVDYLPSYEDLVHSVSMR